MATSSRIGRLRSHVIRLGGLVLLALTAAGCQGRGDVSGKVTYKDKALVFGTVLIHGRDGIRQGNIANDGSYTVRDVAAGEARFAINSINPKDLDIHPGKRPETKPKPYPDAPGWFPIPKQYDNIATSGLTFTVKGGSNTFDIDLK